MSSPRPVPPALPGPLALCRRYAASDLTREALIARLVFYPYTPTSPAGPWDDLAVDPPGTWSELETAQGLRLIDHSIYEEVFTQREANIAGTTAYLTGTGEAVKPNTKDAWFWSPPWQAGEEEVDAALARGEGVTFDSAEEFLADLDRLDVRPR